MRKIIALLCALLMASAAVASRPYGRTAVGYLGGHSTPTCSISTTSPLASATVSSAYSNTISTANCTAPLTWSFSVAPSPNTGSWLSIGSTTGTLSGTPGTAETETGTIKVVDNLSNQATLPFTLTVNSGGSGPSAPTNLLMVLQGQTSAGNTPSAPTPSAPNSTSISWTQATAGAHAIDHNKVYRSTTGPSSGFSVIFTSSTPITTYADNAATAGVGSTQGTSIPYYPGTTYWYKVSAVDTLGTEGPLSSTQSFVQYQNGTQNWNIDYSAAATINFNDTTGAPQGGTADISVTITGAYGLFQPVSSNLTTQWNMWAGAFNYLEFDLKSSVDRSWNIHCLRVGDVTIYNTSVGVSNAVAIAPYGTFVANQWVHYKIPMSVFLIDYGATAGITGSPGIENAVYKWAIQDQSGATGQTWYMDNIKWTP